MDVAKIGPYPLDLQFNVADDITKALAEKDVGPLVRENLKKYATINVRDTMTNLTRVGDLLKLAIAASHNFPCNSTVLKVMSKFQVLIGDSFLTCNSFTNSSLIALQKHVLAIKLMSKGKSEKAVELISKTADLAKAMADGCSKLIKQAEDLRDDSQKALLCAADDKSVTAAKKQEMQKMIADLEVKQKVSQETTKQLAQQVEEARAKESKLESQLKDQMDKAFYIGLVSAVMQPMAQMASAYTSSQAAGATGGASLAMQQQAAQKKQEELNQANDEVKDAKKAVDDKQKELDAQTEADKKAALEKELEELKNRQKIKEEAVGKMSDKLDKVSQQCQEQANSLSASLDQAMQIRVKLQKDMLEENGKLIEAVEKLKNSQVQKDDLEKAIASLEIVVKTMGKVVTVFENTRLFWTAVQDDCQGIAKLLDKDGDIQYVVLLGDDEVTKKIYESGLRWIALGYVNLQARDAMASVKTLKVDEIMNNLPNADEALEIVKTLTDQLSADLNNESKLLSDGHADSTVTNK